MRYRQSFHLILTIFTLSGWSAYGLSTNRTVPEQPNIILIMADDMGYSDLGCYGSEISTPNIDALAGDGIRFTNFYNAGRCCPTRASLLTGLHPHQTGIGHMTRDLDMPAYRGDLNQNCVTIAEVLKSAGSQSSAKAIVISPADQVMPPLACSIFQECEPPGGISSSIR